jgi:glucose-1-phosphate adenylyltransferase
VGTLHSFFQASLDLLRVPPPFPLVDWRWTAASPFWRWQPSVVSAAAEIDGRRVEGRILLSPGVELDDANIVNSVLSYGVQIDAGSELEDCVVLPGARVGRGARLRRVIVDENAWVPAGSVAGHRTGRGGEVTVLTGRRMARDTPTASRCGRGDATFHPLA